MLIPIIEGKPQLFTAPNVPSIDITKFLNVDALSRELRRAQSGMSPEFSQECLNETN